MNGLMREGDIAAEGVVQSLLLAADELRFTTATPDQLTAAAAFLAKALARFGDGTSRDSRQSAAIARLEVAGKAIGAELARRAFTPREHDLLKASEAE
jgi:hypothetical protein